MLKTFVATSAFVYILLTLYTLLYTYSCWTMILPVIGLTVIASSYIEFRIKHRRCAYLCYLNETSKIYQLLSSPYLVVIILLICSVGLTLSIFVEVLFFGTMMWGYLGLHILLMVIINRGLTSSLRKSIKPDMLALIVKEFSVKIGAVILFVVLLMITYYSDTPLYIDTTLSQTIENATNSIGSSCVMVDYLVRFKVEINAVLYWLVSSGTQNLDSGGYKFFVWLVYMLISTLSAIGINRLIVQVIYMTQKYLQSSSEGEGA